MKYPASLTLWIQKHAWLLRVGDGNLGKEVATGGAQLFWGTMKCSKINSSNRYTNDPKVIQLYRE